MKEHGFKYHDHTADITVEAWAPTLPELFEECALATFEVILDTTTVGKQRSFPVHVSGKDLKELLVEWIGELITLIDIEYCFFCSFNVREVRQIDTEYKLEAVVWGEDIDHEKHDTRTEVKAMTYADLEFEISDRKASVVFTLDL